LFLNILKRAGKHCFKELSPHHQSCQKLIFDPFPTSKRTKLRNFSYPLLLYIYKEG
jgi:hypothetical protein